ncbi:GNAT family N-acetyltransferase [Aliiglaciecola sp. CAU 1673]|uniref:GNAT family N-acetyltransferase n=1 Tax=Aliiglaciecola sp. CAU 1673 TaxID=3032595 RepID=UPI0023DC3DCA|nr:GNAT family N-acetyltransferase [Aliiglaciecola sp. CAU 1673]MDF2178098.1 GNAT family N-acetyltransferase [Aliiglaciecola sp. CAU 1673]
MSYLIGQRVSLRPLSKDDAAVMHLSLQEPLINALTDTSGTFSLQDVETYCQRVAVAQNRWDFAIVRPGGEMIGELSLNEWDSTRASANFRIALYQPELLGQGLGAEAARLAIQFGFTDIGLKSISLEVLAINARARRLYQKLGFVEVSQADTAEWVKMELTAECYFAPMRNGRSIVED